jgi:L-iditol 2-dehydrogenase
LGARKVCAIDIDQKRLEFAQEGGWADHTYCLPPRDPVVPPAAKANGAPVINGKVPPAKAVLDEAIQKAKNNVQAALKHFSEPDGFDVVFECTGAEPCIQMGVFVSLTVMEC